MHIYVYHDSSLRECHGYMDHARYMCPYIHTFIHTRTYIYTYIYISDTYIYISGTYEAKYCDICTHIYIHPNTHTNMYIHTYISGTYEAKYRDIYILTHINSYKHTTIYVYIYIHKCIQIRNLRGEVSWYMYPYILTHTQKNIYIYTYQALTRRSKDRPWLTRPRGRVVQRRQSLQHPPTWKASAALPRSCSIHINLYIYICIYKLKCIYVCTNICTSTHGSKCAWRYLTTLKDSAPLPRGCPEKLFVYAYNICIYVYTNTCTSAYGWMWARRHLRSWRLQQLCHVVAMHMYKCINV